MNKLIFGYDEVVDGEAKTNGFPFRGNTSPPNLGMFGYQIPPDIKDQDWSRIPEICPKVHHHHHLGLLHYVDFEVEQVSEIDDRYYYIIDVFPNEFWNHPESKDITLSNKTVIDIKNRKAKILVLFPLEAIRMYFNVSELIQAWCDKYDLPQRSVVIVSGNYSFSEKIKGDKNIVYIPYSQWEQDYACNLNNKQATKRLFKLINKKGKRKKVFLNYNRRARYYRCRLVYELKKAGVIDHGFVSLGKDANESHGEIPQDFYDNLPLTFDNTDLDVNHANELVPEDFMKSYVSVVSETIVEPDELFPSEKIFKAIVGVHPFIVVSTPGFLEMLRGFGYRTFSRWFDESYDNEPDLHKRIAMIVNEVKKLTLKTDTELQDMMFEMLPTLKYNFNKYVKRCTRKELEKKLEGELWR